MKHPPHLRTTKCVAFTENPVTAHRYRKRGAISKYKRPTSPSPFLSYSRRVQRRSISLAVSLSPHSAEKSKSVCMGPRLVVALTRMTLYATCENCLSAATALKCSCTSTRYPRNETTCAARAVAVSIIRE